ncbi:MAG: aldehyde dehydrogenase family protein [Acidimicrobiia bacterium]
MDVGTIDRSLGALAENAARWARIPVATKIYLLDDIRRRVGGVAASWVEAARAAKRLAPGSPLLGEDWTSGPYAVASAAAAYAETLRRIDRSQSPVPPQSIRTLSNGQVAVRVFPTNTEDRLVLSGHTADVWMQPGLTERDVERRAAAFYRVQEPDGSVAVVLGAGNIASIPALDVITELFTHGSVVALKFNPVNAYLGAFFEVIFGALIDGGFVRLLYGGVDEGIYLTRHTLVDRIHVTGAAATHDAIVYGTEPDAAARKAADDPVIAIPVTSELGGVGPTIVVGGEWSSADLRYQAEHIISQKLHNHGFNCVACQILVLPESWDQADGLLDAMRSVVADLHGRWAYYPGASDRQREALEAHPGAEVLTDGSAPVTFITDLDPGNPNDVCFTTEFFGAVLGVVRLPGDDTGSYLRNAVEFANEVLEGNLGANVIIHPATMSRHAQDFNDALHDLRYGTVAVNSWVGVAFAMTRATWGGFPGNRRNDIQSGNGIAHNALMLNGVERTVVHGTFAPFPRTIRLGVWHAEPLPPHFVTNTSAAVIGERLTEYAVTGSTKPIPGLLAAALRG